MQIVIVATGKIKKQSPEYEIMAEYLKRLPWKIVMQELDEDNEAFNCQNLLVDKYKGYSIIQLAPEGELMDSESFAHVIKNISIYKSNKILFLIGGSRGFINEDMIKIEKKISFGKMTYPHKLFRAMLVEQLYRAHTILDGHPYHK